MKGILFFCSRELNSCYVIVVVIFVFSYHVENLAVVSTSPFFDDLGLIFKDTKVRDQIKSFEVIWRSFEVIGVAFMQK